MPKFSSSVTYLCLAAVLASAGAALAQDSGANYRLQARTEPKVDVAELPPAGTGLWAPTDRGLRADVWGKQTYETWSVLLGDIPSSITSPTLRNLVMGALLSNATPPDGDVSPAARQDTRSEALLPFVTGQEYKQFVASTPLAERTVLNATRERDLAFIEEGASACYGLPENAANITELVWQLYCIMAKGNDANRGAAAQLQLDLLRERGMQATAEINLVEAILANEAAPDNPMPLPVPGALSVQTIRLLSLAPEQGLNISTQAPLAQRAYYHTLLERGDTRSAEAAEWLAERGFADADILRTAYGAAAFTETEKANPNQLRGARQRAYLWQALSDANDDATQLRALNDYINVGGADALVGVRGAILAPYLIEIAGSSEHAWAGGNMFALAAAQDVSGAMNGWFGMVNSVAETLPDAKKWQVRIWPLAVALQLQNTEMSQIDSWIAEAQAQPSENRIPVADILTVLEAAGFAIPPQTWATVTDTPTAVSSKQVNTRQLESLRAAAQANQQGEVIVRGIGLVNGDIGDVPPPVAAAVIRALADVELASDAQRLTVEVLLHLLYPSA